jgi:hypothetical protein
MANSWGFDGSQRYPPQFCPWSKIQLGWITPIDLASSQKSVQIRCSYTTGEYIRITKGFPSGEYLLIENRCKLGFDGDLPQVRCILPFANLFLGWIAFHRESDVSFNF